MKHVLWKALCAAGLVGASLSGQAAELELPIVYGDSPYSYDSLGKKVFVGGKPTVINDELTLKASRTLFLVPTQGKLVDAGRKTYESANCSVVQDQYAIEDLASEAIRSYAEVLNEDAAFVAELSAERRTEQRRCLEAIRSRASDRREVCEYKSELATAISEIQESMSFNRDKIDAYYDEANDNLRAFSEEPGGTLTAVASIYGSGELAELKEANRSFNVKLVDIKDIHFNLDLDQDDYRKFNRQAILGYSLAGTPVSADDPRSQTVVTTLKNAGTASMLFSLSRVGACQSTGFERAATITYSYNAYGFIKGRAEWNKWQSYKKIESTTKKGGFFTTKTVHKLHEDMKGETGFKFYAYSTEADDLDEMKEKLRAELLTQMLKDWAEVKQLNSNPNYVATLPNPPANGADVTGDALLKCPHVYCQVGGYALKSLSAIFGRAVTEQEVKRDWDQTTSVEFSNTKTLKRDDSASLIIEWE